MRVLAWVFVVVLEALALWAAYDAGDRQCREFYVPWVERLLSEKQARGERLGLNNAAWSEPSRTNERAPDGTRTARMLYQPMCWLVDAGASTTFSVYVRGKAQLYAATHTEWWVTGWDEGASHDTGAWERVSVQIDNLFGVVCLCGSGGAVMREAMMVQGWPPLPTALALKSLGGEP